MSPDRHTAILKQLTAALGFSYCGISKAGFLADEAHKLEEWLSRGYQGKMSYLENHFDKRLDPTLLVPGAKSVVSLIYNYFPENQQAADAPYKLAKYAYGEDYHHVIKNKLNLLMTQLQEQVGEVEGRVFVDSAPVHERAWAAKGGLGWIGKNSLLLNRKMGSFFFLAELIIDLELVPDGPIKNYCGTCTACQDACPTDAIPEPFVVDGSRCISYLTIELKEEIPQEFQGKAENWVFGCDICQDVCPWNRFSKPHQEPAFSPQGWQDLSKKDWQEMTQEVFSRVFKNAAVKRTKHTGLMRNIRFVNDQTDK